MKDYSLCNEEKMGRKTQIDKSRTCLDVFNTFFMKLAS